MKYVISRLSIWNNYRRGERKDAAHLQCLSDTVIGMPDEKR